MQKTVAFLAKDMTIASLVDQRGDLHHIFPKKYLQEKGFSQKLYNQVANYVEIGQHVNIKIGKKSPTEYMEDIRKDIEIGKQELTDIQSLDQLISNIEENDLPKNFEKLEYSDFLERRRQLMAKRIKEYYKSL